MRRLIALVAVGLAACSGDLDGVTYSEPDVSDADIGADAHDGADLADADPDGPDVPDFADAVEDDLPDAQPDAAPDTPDEPDPCQTFGVAAPAVVLPPLRSHEIVAMGGSGDYRWSFAPGGNRSGAILDENSGLYLSGRVGGVFDDLVVQDVGCARSEAVRVEVVAAMLLLPTEAQAAPGDAFCFELTGGSGQQEDPDGPFEWRRSQRGSGPDGDVDTAGCYVAGNVEGVDIVVVEDAKTGESREARVQVTRQPITLRAAAPHIMIPAGESFPLRVTGGSGTYDFAVRGEADVVMEPDADEPWTGGRLTAFLVPGQAQLVVTDRFAPERQLTVPVDVMARLSHDYVAYGTHSDGTTVVAIGDVNGDGHGDVAVGSRAVSLNGQHAGAVYIYLGGQETESGLGLGRTPAQILYGVQRYDYFGRAIASGDFDGDGCNDLAIPAWGRASPSSQTGAVEIWSGCNGQPAADPYKGAYYGRVRDNLPSVPAVPVLRQRQVLEGPVAVARFGFAVARGDFNGDGRDDLAVSSPFDESPVLVNPNNNPFPNNGRVRIYLGTDDGLSSEPWLVVDGLIVEPDGATHGALNLEFGQRMDAADLNGDGCDDLLVGMPRYDDYSGAASLHLSAPSDEFPSGCALTAPPAVFVVAAQEDSRRGGRIGWEVELADLDGDCVPDILSSQFTAAVPGRGTTSAGGVFFVSGDPAWSGDAPIRVGRDAARWVAWGDDWDNLGTDFSTGDVDGDGVRDLAVAVRYGEGPGTIGDVGEVRIYPGLAQPGCDGLAPDAEPFGEPASLYNVDRWADLFGQSVAIVPDVDGDDVDDLVVLSPRGPSGALADHEDHLGRAFVFSGGGDWNFQDGATLQMPVVMAEEFYGYAVEVVRDFNGDGYDDLLTGAPYFDRDDVRTNDTVVHQSAGVAYMHYGGRDGIRPQPDLIFRDHEHHSGSDLLGYGLGTAGDFDGDATADVVVAALGEDSFGGPCVACRVDGASVSGIGAAYVYLGGTRWGGPHSGSLDETPRASDPDFVICGPPTVNVQMGREVYGDFDHDGDGYDDLLLSNWNWDANRGRLWFVRGRARTDTPQTICVSDEDQVAAGENVSDYIGWRMAATDLNGDGCDDIMTGGFYVDQPGRRDAGVVRVRLGSGGLRCPPRPVDVELVGEAANENMGYGLAVADVDGDGLQDVLVGSTGIGPSNEGAVTVLDGLALREVLRDVDGGLTLPMDASLRLGHLRDPLRRAGVDFGRSIANLGDIDGDGMDDVAVGARLSRISAVDDEATGGAFVFSGATDVASLESPEVWIGGESRLALGYFGERVAGGRLGPNGAAIIAVGAPYSDSIGPGAGEIGAVFVGELRP